MEHSSSSSSMRRPLQGHSSSAVFTPPQQAAAVRHTPPSASGYIYETPSCSQPRQQEQNLRSYSQRTSRSTTTGLPFPAVATFDSPFMSPPPTVHRQPQSHSARSTRSIPSQQQSYYYHTHRPSNLDSPFQSPPPTVQSKQQRPQPLVLDPSATTSTPSYCSPYPINGNVDHNRSDSTYSQSTHYSPGLIPPSSVASSSTNPATGMAQKLLQVATRRIRDQSLPVRVEGGGQYHATPLIRAASQSSAAKLSHTCAKAGYLQKMGQHIPEFKRRFFLLQAETTLYYYLSPNDTEPRGKLVLDEHTQITPIETLPDGRYRFAVDVADDLGPPLNPSSGGDGTSSPSSASSSRRRVILEARSKEMGEEWMERLRNDRVSAMKSEVDTLTSERQTQAQEIQDLKRQIEHFKHVEADRDGALEDARQWKDQFERLDEALRLLTQRMRQPPPVETSSPSGTSSPLGAAQTEEEKKATESLQSIEGFEDEKHTDALPMERHGNDETPTKNNQSKKDKTSYLAPLVLLDTAFQDVGADEPEQDIEEIRSVPGTYFSGLINAYQQQRESLRLAAQEATTAVEDVQEAQASVDAMKKRMERAEKHLTKLWEENCDIRKTLKQKKREKRVLIREYKVLQQSNKELEESASAAAVIQAKHKNQAKRLSPRGAPMRTITQEEEEDENAHNGPMEDTMLGSDEERLIMELEEHVASSIRLHERLLAANDFMDPREGDRNTSMEGSEALDEELSHSDSHAESLRFESTWDGQMGQNGSASSNHSQALQPKLVSLIDDEESESESEDGRDAEAEDKDEDEDDDDVGVNEYQSMVSSVVSSVGAEFGSVGEFSQQSAPTLPHSRSPDSTPERPNPILQLDQEDDDIDEYDHQPALCSSSTQSQSTSSKSVITDNGNATSRLVCPLADVVEAKGASQTPADAHMDLAVYHLTFYSRKIGIQFQKAPPAPTKPKGLLTAAMTADLTGEPNGSDKTAAELRNVAAIYSLAIGRNGRNEEVCPVSMPEDVVLVCGFHGFDVSGMNQKPKLGARLVAFDGISVEIGHWTFDSIRKGIKARSRPLTLSFRNDFLTTEQRSVLTKAVMEVDAKCPPPRPSVQFGARPPSTTPSINSALSHDTEYFVNDSDNTRGNSFVPEHDLSTWAQEKECCHEKFAAASNSVSTHYGRLRRLSSGSHSTNQSHNFRSFSEAGSSITSNFAPLVANLVKSVSERKREETAEFTPEYLRRAVSVENSPQHQDFRSNLL